MNFITPLPKYTTCSPRRVGTEYTELSRREQGHGLEIHIAIAGTRDPSGNGASFFWRFLYRIHRLHRVIGNLRTRDAT